MDASTATRAPLPAPVAAGDGAEPAVRVPRIDRPAWLTTYVAVLAAVDAVAMTGATLLARLWWLGPGPAELHIREMRLPYDLLPLATVPTWLVILALAGAYDLGPFGSTHGLWTRVVRAGAQLLAVVAVTYYVLHLQMLGRGVLVAVIPLAVGFTLLGRAAVGAVVRRARHQGRARRTALVAGSRRGIEAVVQQLADHQAAGITPIDMLVVGEDAPPPGPATGNGNGGEAAGTPTAATTGNGDTAGNGNGDDAAGAPGSVAPSSGTTGNGNGATGKGAAGTPAAADTTGNGGATGNGAAADPAMIDGSPANGTGRTSGNGDAAGNGASGVGGAAGRGGLPVASGDPVRAVTAALARSGAEALIVTGDLAKGQLRDIAWQLEGTGVELLVVAAAPGDLEGLRPQVRPVAGLPLLYVD